MASAASTCVYDSPTNKMTLTLGAPAGQPVTIGSGLGRTLTFRDGDGIAKNCFQPGSSLVAGSSSTDRIVVRGTPGLERVIVDERNAGAVGPLEPGATAETTGKSDIEVVMTTGTGGDLLEVIGKETADSISVSGSTIGGQVDINNDGDTDIAISAPSRITVSGEGGNDFLIGINSAGQSALLPLTLDGGLGDDTVIGGAGGDSLLGGIGFGADFLSSVDGKHDIVAGQNGADSGVVDTTDTVTGIETLTTKVGRLRLAPSVLHPTVGRAARATLRWTHPDSWRRLRAIQLRMYDGAEQVGTVSLNPRAERITAKGALKVSGSTLRHHGKTVTARLRLRASQSLAGQTLRVAVQATDRDGRKQLEPAAGVIKVK
jgi:hypothetical protein